MQTETKIWSIVKVPHTSPWRYKKSRLFLCIKNEKILDNLANRRSRPVDKYKSLLPDIVAALELEPRKVKWSQYAGCTCPCSPGFIMDHSQGKDYHVTIDGGAE